MECVVDKAPLLTDLFISYSRKDSRVVSIVVKDFERNGLTTWQDTSNIQYGERFREAIMAGIQKSQIIVIFISSHSLQSRWVLNELDMAMLREIQERKTVVYPILIGRINERNLPEDLKGKKYVDLRHGFKLKYHRIRNALLETIKLSILPQNSKVVRTIDVGEPLIKFITDYQFKGQHENFHIEHDIVQNIADIFIEHLSSYDKTNPEYKTARRDFLQEYGRHALRKLIIFTFEDLRFSFTRGFTVENIMEVISSTNVMVWMFDLQKRVLNKVDGQIKMVTEDSPARFYIKYETSNSFFADLHNRNI